MISGPVETRFSKSTDNLLLSHNNRVRGVSSFLGLGGQVVHNAVFVPPLLPGGAF